MMKVRSRWACLLLAATCACGPPTSGVKDIDESQVPYNLLTDPAGSPPSTPSHPMRSHPALHWVDGDKLVVIPSSVSCRPADRQLLDELLAELVQGPGEEARDDGLSTAITPDTVLTVRDVDSGTVVLDLIAPSQISADRLPLAIGQIVLTVASAGDVDSVVLTNEGDPVEVPLPGGALTSDSLSAEDYAALVRTRGETRNGSVLPRSSPCDDR